MLVQYALGIVGFLGFVGTAVEIFRGKNRLAIALFVITVVSSVFAAVLWTRDQELRDTRRVAAEILETMPQAEYEFLSDGDLEGIVLATIGFLEARESQFPETLAAARTTYRELQKQLEEDDPRLCPAEEPISCPSAVRDRNRERVERAAGAMQGLMRSVAGPTEGG